MQSFNLSFCFLRRASGVAPCYRRLRASQMFLLVLHSILRKAGKISFPKMPILVHLRGLPPFFILSKFSLSVLATSQWSFGHLWRHLWCGLFSMFFFLCGGSVCCSLLHGGVLEMGRIREDSFCLRLSIS